MPDARELTDWMAFDRIELIGDARLDYLLARLAVLLRACWIERKEGQEGESVADLMPTWGFDRPDKGGFDAEAELQALAARMKGKIIDVDDW